MKLKEIGLVSHFPIWEFINSPSPLVFIKIGDRQIDLINVKRINGKFFHTKLGVFELDGEYECVMMGQPFYIYNLQNGKPISLRHIERIQALYRTNKTLELTEILSTISENLEKGLASKMHDEDEEEQTYEYDRVTPLEALRTILKSRPKFIEEDDIKFIINYKWFDMSDLKIFNFIKISEKNTEKDISKKIPTIIPMVIVSVIGISTVMVLAFSGIGSVIREIGDPRNVPAQFIIGLKNFIPQLLGILS